MPEPPTRTLITPLRASGLAGLVALLGVLYFWPPRPALEQALEAMDDAQVELLSVEPKMQFFREQLIAPEGLFRMHKIMGSVVLDSQERAQVKQSLWSAASGFSVLSAHGFTPHYALRIRAASGKYDLLICFECGHLQMFDADAQAQTFDIRGNGQILDNLLAKHGIVQPSASPP